MKKNKKLLHVKLVNLIAFFIILFLIFIYFVFCYIKKQIMPSIFKYGSIEAKKFSSIIVNDAIDKYVSKQIEVDEIFNIVYDKNNEIKSIDLNTNLVNSYLVQATKSIQKNLKYIEIGQIDKVEYKTGLLDTYEKKNLKKGIIFYLNTGFIFDNPIFSNFGNQIPIKLALTGDIVSNIKTEIENYGINNALIKVYVNLKLSQQIILPFYSKDIILKSKIPIAMKMVTGNVPSYYGNLNTSSISIPNK